MAQIETAGFEILSWEEKNSFDKLCENYLKKIERKIKDLSSITFHLKDYSREGKRNKYSLHAKFVVSGKNFEASSDGWDFPIVIHEIFDKIPQEMESRFRISDKGKK